MSTVGMDTILANQSSTTGTTVSNSSSSLEVTDFYNLLIKQLQFQDPLNPVENTEFTAQLAQFSSLQALNSMQTSMETLSALQASTNNLTALSLIGKHVVAQGNIVNYSGANETLNFSLDDDAQTVTVKIYSSDGKLVRTDEMTRVSSGDSEYTWDGRDDEGNTLSQGKYYFAISAEDYEGNSVITTTYAKGQVTGVKYDGGNTYLTIGNKDVALSDIQKIQE